MKKTIIIFLALSFLACQKEVSDSKDRIPKYDITATCYDQAAKVYNVDLYFRNCQNSDTQICVYTLRGKAMDSVIALGINGIHHVQFATNKTDVGGISVYVKNADTIYPAKTKLLDNTVCE